MIYALERESAGLYVLCKLGGWVDVEELAQWATVICAERIKPVLPKSAAPGFPAHITAQMHKEEKKRKLVIEEIHQSIVRKRSSTITGRDENSQPPAMTDPSHAVDRSDDQSALPEQECSAKPVENTLLTPKAPTSLNPHPTPGEDSLTQPNAEAIFQNIRNQYLEALYHSMVSAVVCQLFG